MALPKINSNHLRKISVVYRLLLLISKTNLCIFLEFFLWNLTDIRRSLGSILLFPGGVCIVPCLSCTLPFGKFWEEGCYKFFAIFFCLFTMSWKWKFLGGKRKKNLWGGLPMQDPALMVLIMGLESIFNYCRDEFSKDLQRFDGFDYINSKFSASFMN